MEDDINKINPFTLQIGKLQSREFKLACLWPHCWNHIMGRARTRTGVLWMYFFLMCFLIHFAILLSDSSCFWQTLGHGVTEKANLELKEASLSPSTHTHTQFIYNQNTWSDSNSIIEPTNYQPKWNWTKIKVWPMARNYWIYISESKNATPNYYSHPWIIRLVYPMSLVFLFLPSCLIQSFYCSLVLPPEGRPNRPEKVKI